MIGRQLNNYEIVSKVGEGGMGTVYLAHHVTMGRKAAVKVLRPEYVQNAGLVRRFMNEARAVNAIGHPNIIDIIDVGTLPDGLPYLMMEYLNGEPLGRRLRRERRLPIPAAVEIAMQTAAALDAAHGKQIVHRDLKPDNLFLIPDDTLPSGERVKVLDFGVAKLRGEETGDSLVTRAGALMGTPPYMSPEQCRGLTTIDGRTDIYALGIILFEMLTGERPFTGQAWGDIIIRHMTEQPPAPSSRNSAVTAALDAVVLRALAKEPDARFASMAELRHVLSAAVAPPAAEPHESYAMPSLVTVAPSEAVQEGKTPAWSPEGEPSLSSGEMPSFYRPARRWLWWALGAGGLVAAALLVWLFAGRSNTADAPPSAVRASRQAAQAGDPLGSEQKPVETTAPSSTVPPPPSATAAPVRTVVLRVQSVPAGAQVSDDASGEVLGTTPLVRTAQSSDGAFTLRLQKPGYRGATVSARRDRDEVFSIELEEEPVSRRRPGRDGSGVKPAAAKTGAELAQPPSTAEQATDPATGPATAPPPLPSRRPVEKW